MRKPIKLSFQNLLNFQYAFRDLTTPFSMDCRKNLLGGKKRFEEILILLSMDDLGSYLQLMQPFVAPSRISHLML